MKKLIWANFKMFKTRKELQDYFDIFLENNISDENLDIVIAPMMLNMETASDALIHSDIHLWSQNMHFSENGWFTGEVSPLNLVELNVNYVILWHSERRSYFGEQNDFINQKVISALNHGIRPILCIGENLDQKNDGKTIEVLQNQLEQWLKWINDLSQVDIAYEPVWAIGTGLTATPDYVSEIHAFIKKFVDNSKTRVIYWWSVKPENATDLINTPNVDGFLIWWASLDPVKFIDIIEQCK